MTDAPLLLTPTATVSREAFFARCHHLAACLAMQPDLPMLPLCEGRGDFMAALVAGLSLGRRVILPNDNGAPALSAVIAETGPALVVLGADDVDPGLGVPILRLDPTFPADAADAPDWRSGAPLTLYTSGSTGRPTAHRHAPAMFLAGAAAWTERLDLGTAPATIVATVPAQHMYGLEASVMLPLVRPGTTTTDGRPFYPADVQAALDRASGNRILVTTPLHLQALVRSAVALPALHRIVSATAPLPTDLARRAEVLWGAPVVEVYGSTETGLVATRRPAVSPAFTLRRDLSLEKAPESVVLRGAHLAAPVCIHDRVEAEGTDGFRLLGRGADLVNVAGKRASLAGLTAHLLSVEGVRDGVVVVPEEAGPAARPVAIAVAPGRTATDIREALRQRLPDVFVPRRVILVDALPRSATGKLPAAAVADLLRRPASSFSIPPHHPSLAGHFPGNPIVPGVVILDHALHLADLENTRSLRQVKFHSPLRPDEPCMVDITRGTRGLVLTCRCGDRTILTAVLAPEPEQT